MQEFGGIGGASSLVLGLVALMWIGLLIPGLVRRRNESASERYAVRLQQTIRAMAETAEAPAVLELEASARGVRAQRRALDRHRKAIERAERERARVDAERRELESELAVARARAELQDQEHRAAHLRAASQDLTDSRSQEEPMTAQIDPQRREAAARARAASRRRAEEEASARTASERWANGASGALRAEERRHTDEAPLISAPMRNVAADRRRRGRLASTSTGAIGILVVVAGVLLGGNWPLIVAGTALVVGAAWMLNRLARVSSAAAARSSAERAPLHSSPTTPRANAPERPDHDLDVNLLSAPVPVASTASPAAWTPVPVPKPLYLDRATAAEVAEEAAAEAAHAGAPGPDGPDGGTSADESLRELLRAEAARSEQTLRAAHDASEVAEFSTSRRVVLDADRVPAITVSAGTFAGMGDVDALAGELGDGEFGDLDSVLRRRRAV